MSNPLRNPAINYGDGWFFVTAQVAHNKSQFGVVAGGRCELNELGRLVLFMCSTTPPASGTATSAPAAPSKPCCAPSRSPHPNLHTPTIHHYRKPDLRVRPRERPTP